MKTSILFVILAFTSLLQKQTDPKVLIILHSTYNNNNGIACVAYGDVLYSMKWFGIENSVSKEKRWEIKQVNECSFGGPNSDFQEDSIDSKEAKDEITMQLLRVIKAPNHPE
jgi:hypothetical protein